MNSKEQGAASIIVTMEDGKLKVTHGQSAWAVLHERDADAGIWDAIWDVIRNYQKDESMTDYDHMNINIGKKGIITNTIGSLSDHIGYDGELLTIVDVVDGFYVTNPEDSKCGASYHCDENEFKILN